MADDRYPDAQARGPEWADSDLPQTAALVALAHHAERSASGLAATAVRRLGTRRRRRRQAAVGVGALALVVAAGSVAFGSSGPLLTREPSVVSTPTPTVQLAAPTPTGPIEDVNELSVGDIAHRSTERVTKLDLDRSLVVGSACVGDGLDGEVENWGSVRDFGIRPTDPEVTPDPDAPLVGTLVHTEIRGTDNAADGDSLYASVKHQVESCAEALSTDHDTILGPKTVVWVDVDPGVAGSRGGYGSVVYRKPGEKGEEAWFESVGVTQYRERLMITVRLVHVPEDNWSDRAGGAPADGLAENPQFGLIRASAQRLRR